MGLLSYGRTKIRLDDATLLVLAALMKEILAAGAAEWVSVKTLDPEGAVDLLISAGVDVTIRYDSPDGSDEHLRGLLDKYVPEAMPSGDE